MRGEGHEAAMKVGRPPSSGVDATLEVPEEVPLQFGIGSFKLHMEPTISIFHAVILGVAEGIH